MLKRAKCYVLCATVDVHRAMFEVHRAMFDVRRTSTSARCTRHSGEPWHPGTAWHLFERLYPWQFTSTEEFEGSAAAGGDVGDAVRDACLGHRGY